MKKKAAVVGIILCLIILLTICFSMPSPVLASYEDIDIRHVSITNQEYIEEDITDRIDCVELVKTLSSYKRSRIPHTFAPYQMAAGDIQIDGTSGNGPVHILLGRDSVIYESADKGGYTIHKSGQLVNDIMQMIEE